MCMFLLRRCIGDVFKTNSSGKGARDSGTYSEATYIIVSDLGKTR